MRDLVSEITGQDAAGMTTGNAAQVLLGHAKRDGALLTPEVRDWLKRVVKAAEKRNEAMHAMARDQCVPCGDAEGTKAFTEVIGFLGTVPRA